MIKTVCLINIESALNIALRVEITIRILIKLNFIFMTWSSLLLESGVHFRADIVKKINYFLVVLLPTILFNLESLSDVVERLCKVRNLPHSLEFIESEDDLRLDLLPLCLVIEKEKLDFSDDFVFTLPNVVVLHLKRSLDVTHEEVGVCKLLLGFGGLVLDHLGHFSILGVELLLHFA